MMHSYSADTRISLKHRMTRDVYDSMDVDIL